MSRPYRHALSTRAQTRPWVLLLACRNIVASTPSQPPSATRSLVRSRALTKLRISDLSTLTLAWTAPLEPALSPSTMAIFTPHLVFPARWVGRLRGNSAAWTISCRIIEFKVPWSPARWLRTISITILSHKAQRPRVQRSRRRPNLSLPWAAHLASTFGGPLRRRPSLTRLGKIMLVAQRILPDLQSHRYPRLRNPS
jgi:hypothetical protein